MKCCKCNEQCYHFMYEYKGEIYCEDCLGDMLFNLFNLIDYINSDTDLQDEIYIEWSFGCKLEKSSAILRKVCTAATLEEWINGNDEWKSLKKKYAWRKDFLEMFGAKQIVEE